MNVEVQAEDRHSTVTFEYHKEVSIDETIEKNQRNIPPYIKHNHGVQRNPEKRKKRKKKLDLTKDRNVKRRLKWIEYYYKTGNRTKRELRADKPGTILMDVEYFY